jgi:hypothetical protein
MNKIIVPMHSVSQRYSFGKRYSSFGKISSSFGKRYSSFGKRYSSFGKISSSFGKISSSFGKRCFTSTFTNLKTKTSDFLKTSEYQAYASFCIAVSIFASACDDSVYNLKSLSHHEKIIYIITKGFVVGLTYPISFPLIACYVSYVSYKKNKESKDSQLV